MSKVPSLRLLHKFSPGNRSHTLTPAQRLMYTSEKASNFRVIARICATRSHYVLSISDLASAELQLELAELGQFAEVAYAVLDPVFVFEHLNVLSKADFPLEGYDALPGTVPISSFVGHTAKLPGYVAYRAGTRQLIVAFSGTRSIRQALYDFDFAKHKHPAHHECMVHHGFWKLYKGCRADAIEGVKRGLREHDVAELVVTGHSLGGAVAFLLALDFLAGAYVDVVPDNVAFKIVGFGSPRVGNAKLVQLWRDTLREQGVPALPPARFGYRHLTEQPLYFHHGRLFHIPSSENEHGVFDVKEEAVWTNDLPQHPRGGHNYYNGRDLEGVARRMEWIDDMMKGGTEWESSYTAKVAKYERKLKRKLERVGKSSPDHV